MNGSPAFSEWLGKVKNLAKMVFHDGLIEAFFNFNSKNFSAIEDSLDGLIIDYRLSSQ